ncbi:hypothetical protein BH09ACT4_BH09ACT4_03960 [soil metagenome]
MLESRCAICSDPGRRTAVNRALLAGDTPATILRDLGDTLSLSSSSVYRHCRQHQPAYAPAWLDDQTTVTDVVLGLVQLRRSLLEQRADALAHGQHAAATQVAGRIESVSVSLLREAHVTEESQAIYANYCERIFRTVALTLRAHPELGDPLAEGARGEGYTEWADDITTTT